jgi:TrmH family RNA methyltransferase
LARRLSITSAGNPRLRALRQLRRRGCQDAFLAEGFRQLTHALDAGADVREVYTAPDLYLGQTEAAVVSEAESRGAEVVELGAAAFRTVAGQARPDGLLAVVGRWSLDLAALELGPSPLVVVAEAIARPGNLGTILRSACAAAADALVACDARASLFHPETVQGSVGAHFHLPLAAGATDETVAWLERLGVPIVVAAPHAATRYWEVELCGPVALVVGNERNGVSQGWLDAADEAVSIPMGDGVDSLNVAVAAGIVLFEASRQRSIAAGVSSASERRTTSASASASSSGGKDGFGIATTRIPAPRALRMPLCESSTAAQRPASTPSRRAASRYTSGDGFPRATSSEETVTRKKRPRAASSSTASIRGRFDDEARPSGQRAARRSTASTAPGTSGKRSR